MLGYKCLYSKSPHSFLFSVVANVGPRGASRPLAVAYRQGNDRDTPVSSLARVENVVADTLALIEILSDPANRAPLEAERALAGDCIPDSPQPPFVVPDGSQRSEKPQTLPELPYLIVLDISDLDSGVKRVASLSLCVDKFKLEGDEGDLGNLVAALAQSTALKQLCFLQGPDRDNDDASARFYTQLLLRGRSLGDLRWLRDKTIYPTHAFSISSRSRKFILPSTITFTSAVVQVFPVIYMFTFMGHQGQDIADVDHQNSHYYDIGNTLLDAEPFALRFLSYLRSVGSGSDKAILRFAYGGASSSLITTANDDKSPPPSSSSGRFAVSPTPAGFFGNHVANDESRVRVRNIHPGSWVLLLDQQGRSSSDDDEVFLRYSFLGVCRTSAEIAPEQEQQRPVPVPDLVEVVGGLTEFLRETVPGIDISTWDKRIEEAEKDLRARQASLQTGNRCIGVSVMAERSARAFLDQLL
ncbi:hypothetical protein N7449_007859 [Penicillium cf. viridicatum]|uniref:Uncharacterized protein n=1 Tax=Penicillium cf. viridicatum TaxID=2972119 RepID=A0A9W9MCG5_9EURO|nr:hypothetical protein N7449_007859 [Penicillium cf. viridicatum]